MLPHAEHLLHHEASAAVTEVKPLLPLCGGLEVRSEQVLLGDTTIGKHEAILAQERDGILQ